MPSSSAIQCHKDALTHGAFLAATAAAAATAAGAGAGGGADQQKKAIAQLRKSIEWLSKQLATPGFVQKAPPDKVSSGPNIPECAPVHPY